MNRPIGEKRWYNWNRSEYKSPQIETYKTRKEAYTRAKKLRKLWRGDKFKVKAVGR